MVAFRFSGCFCWGPFVWVKEIHPNLQEIFPGSASLDSHIFVSLNLGATPKMVVQYPTKPMGFSDPKNDQHLEVWKMGGNPPFSRKHPTFLIFFRWARWIFLEFFVFGCPTGPPWTSSGAWVFFFGQKNPKGALCWGGIGTSENILDFWMTFLLAEVLATPFRTLWDSNHKVCYVEHMFSNYIFSTWRIIPVSRCLITMASFRPVSRLRTGIESEFSG